MTVFRGRKWTPGLENVLIYPVVGTPPTTIGGPSPTPTPHPTTTTAAAAATTTMTTTTTTTTTTHQKGPVLITECLTSDHPYALPPKHGFLAATRSYTCIYIYTRIYTFTYIYICTHIYIHPKP